MLDARLQGVDCLGGRVRYEAVFRAIVEELGDVGFLETFQTEFVGGHGCGDGDDGFPARLAS